MADINVVAELIRSAIALRLVGTRALACNTYKVSERDKVESLSREIHRIADEIEQLSLGARQMGSLRSSHI